MRRFVLLAVTAALLSGSPTLCLAKEPGGQIETLPAVDSDGRTVPLTIDQLHPDERTRFVQMAPGSDDARTFLYTRGYLRFCREVIEGRRDPLDLPRLPLRVNWNRQFLNPG